MILLDSGTREMAAGIVANIEKLRFRPQDIKIILSSHAHWDHVEGHAEMRKLTGARVMALGDDAIAIRIGFDNSAANISSYSWAAPVSIGAYVFWEISVTQVSRTTTLKRSER